MLGNIWTSELFVESDFLYNSLTPLSKTSFCSSLTVSFPALPRFHPIDVRTNDIAVCPSYGTKRLPLPYLRSITPCEEP